MYGLEIEGKLHNVGTYSTIAKGNVLNSSSVLIYKNMHTDISQFVGITIPSMARNREMREIRPKVIETADYIGFTPAEFNPPPPEPLPEESPARLVRNSSDLEYLLKLVTQNEAYINTYHTKEVADLEDDFSILLPRFKGSLDGSVKTIKLFVSEEEPIIEEALSGYYNWLNPVSDAVYNYVSGVWVPVVQISMDGVGSNIQDQYFYFQGEECLFVPIKSIVSPITNDLFIDSIKDSGTYGVIKYGGKGVTDSSLNNTETITLQLGHPYYASINNISSFITDKLVTITYPEPEPEPEPVVEPEPEPVVEPEPEPVVEPEPEPEPIIEISYVTQSTYFDIPFFSICSVPKDVYDTSFGFYNNLWVSTLGSGYYDKLLWSTGKHVRYWIFELLLSIEVYNRYMAPSYRYTDTCRLVNKFWLEKSSQFYDYYEYERDNIMLGASKFVDVFDFESYTYNLEEIESDEDFEAYLASLGTDVLNALAQYDMYNEKLSGLVSKRDISKLLVWNGLDDNSDPYNKYNFNFYYLALQHRLTYNTEIDEVRYESLTNFPLIARDDILRENPDALAFDGPVSNKFLVLGR